MSLFGLSPGPSFEASFGWPKYGPNPNRNFKSVGAVRLPTGPIFFFFFFFFFFVVQQGQGCLRRAAAAGRLLWWGGGVIGYRCFVGVNLSSFTLALTLHKWRQRLARSLCCLGAVLWPLHDIVTTNIVWCIAYTREFEGGVVYCPNIVQ